MSDDDKKNDLRALFSSRGAGAAKGVTTKLLGSETAGSSAPATRSESSPETQNNVAATQKAPAPKPAARPISSDPKMMKTKLSNEANIIMKEARRELGGGDSDEGTSKEVSEAEIANAVDKVLTRHKIQIDDIERANIIISLQKDLLGWGVLQPLIDNREVTDIHVYDYQTVVLQRGKISETTGLHWPSRQAYLAFIDRLLLKLGKSLSTQQHSVDAALPNGTRICAIHDSVCGQRGPLLCVRVPRISEVSLESLITYQVAPPLIVNYLAALVRSGRATMMVAGETGTGKTTLIKCLGTQFGPDESIVSVEDTPELNFQHPYFRSLVSRPPNSEGIGEVTLQEHIKTTLRMTPTRVILGEMRTPYAAEAFLESAQTGHVGMSTVHARNAKETLVRLESLLGRAQKSVSIDIIRQQIALAVDSVVWLLRDKQTGRPRIGEIIEVGHFVEGAIQVRPMFSLIKTGERPVWRVESWSSQFDDVLSESGIFLGESPPEITLGNN